MADDQSFKGDSKVPLKSPLAAVEQLVIKYLVPRFPGWIEGYQLTLSTILWCAGLLLSGYLARGNPGWLWLASAMLFLQWFTDSIDGALGKYRDFGIPKWGYYMDHLLDYFFMSAALGVYAVLFDGIDRALVLVLILLFGGFMVNSYLSFAATGEFKITFLGAGPTESRLALIILNTLVIIFGAGFVEQALPYALAVLGVVLIVVVYRTQRYIWRMDMADKKSSLEGSGEVPDSGN
jgi:phosphatidylglycerophosphate synthase